MIAAMVAAFLFLFGLLAASTMILMQRAWGGAYDSRQKGR